MNDDGQVQVLELPEMKRDFNSSLQSNDHGLDIEIYQFTNPSWPGEAEVFLPLR
ncbi:hypothetical protein MHH60_08300 [Paenibacillus sp. FSL H7-0716]|uniref:hypothetical protein n=1 Tax=Paenibacillus TaxID=44249 RepID=UPI0013A698BC|nr:hypothetical protein [Paenibacillus odorifer]